MTKIIKNKKKLSLNCIKVRQPIGEFFIASIKSNDLLGIVYQDIRRVMEQEKRDVEKYLGIQRPLNDSRVKEISEYVNTLDACFPTAILLAVEGNCAEFDEEKNILHLTEHIDTNEDELPTKYGNIAKILDGQHRIAGLENFHGEIFDLNVSIFIDADIAEQASIFSTVNLAQTKVSKSLAYDLFDLANARSPQKTCHVVAVALDQTSNSPFYKRIKRLGVSTKGRFNETITQATVVQSLIKYVSNNPMLDRDTLMRGRKLKKVSSDELNKIIFQHMFVEGKDVDITQILFNYFSAVKERWPDAWSTLGRGAILNKTNGFKALMRFLRPVYLNVMRYFGDIPTKDKFLGIFNKVNIADEEFNIDNFKPGTSGESALFHILLDKSRL